MNELTHDRRYRYQNYQHMMTRKGCDAWADAMMDLMEMVDRLAADNADLREQLQQAQAQLAETLTAPKFIDKVTELGNHVATLVPVRKFDIVPYHNNKRYSLTWAVELASGTTRDFNVLVTDDGKNEPFSADESVDEIVRTIQRQIAQWEYEELLQRPAR